MFKHFLRKRLALFTEFFGAFIRYTLQVREVLVTFLLILFLGCLLIWRYEDISFGNAVYFTFITGLSIGYGDITPETTMGKIVSVGIGLVGVLPVGLSIAIATRALADTAKRHTEMESEL